MLQHKAQVNQNSKCGEIYFLANNFYFFCLTCELKFEDYLEFKCHFDKIHLKNFVDAKCISGEWNSSEDEALQNTNDLKTTSEDSNDPLSWICDYKKDFQKPDADIFGVSLYEIKSLTIDSPVVNDAQNPENDKKNVQLVQGNEDLETNSSSSSCAGNNVSSIDSQIDWTKPYNPTQNLIKRTYKPRNMPTHACTYCDRTFRRRYQLDTHLHIHTGEKPNQCDICGRRFRALTTLQRHLNTHKKSKDHGCKFCDKTFSHRAALLSHESRHIQQRTVSCDECEKKFYTTNHCDTHKRRVHKKTNAALPSLPFACDVCSNRYRSASMLSTHKLRKHLKTAQFSCEKCDTKFLDLKKLMQHQNIHINKAKAS